MNLLLHPETEQAVTQCLSSNAHAFMLVGSSGSGKLSVAYYLTEQLLGVTSLENQPGLKLVTTEKGSIGIDAIRAVQQFLRLKTTGQQRIRRVLIIENAHTMTIEAQNAFLKLLEEPPADTCVILTVAAGQHMLATIHSRAQSITIQAPSKSALEVYFSQQGSSSSDIQKAYLLSGGQIGLMTALLSNEADHPLLDYVDRAKQFLTQSAYERLTHLDEFAKDREQLALLLQALKRMSSTAFDQSALQHKTAQAKHWHHIRTQVLSAESNLKASPNVKLALTDLSLAL